MARPSALHLSGTDATTGQPIDLYAAGGVFVDSPVRDPIELTGWALPGFVDAHCHVGYSPDGAVSLHQAEHQAGPTWRPVCWRSVTAGRRWTPGR